MGLKALSCGIVLTVITFLHCAPTRPPITSTAPEAKPIIKQGVNISRFRYIDRVIEKAISKADIPGAVVLVSRHGKILWRKAYGYCQLYPQRRPMRVDMMFDMASVTKPVATATSIMILAERGQLRLTDRVSDYVPGFSRYIYPDSTQAGDARIWHLLTHTSGLQPYTNADRAADSLGRPCTTEALVNYIAHLPKLNAPGDEYHYSCLGFITLAYIIKKVSGKDVNQFAKENIFRPLGMDHTTFVPDETLRPFCVPTEVDGAQPFVGIVHDPLARLQGGISGNAGLFSTADDLAKFARMMMNGGILDGHRILSPVTVERMIHIPDTPAKAKRGYGWVVKDGISWVGGDLLPDGSYGHTGYTGTSIWMDNKTDTFIIILTNRVHPNDNGSVSWLRSSIANIVAGAIVDY